MQNRFSGVFQYSGGVLLTKGKPLVFEGQHAIRAQVFVCIFSKFLQREKDFDVGHALAVSLFQMFEFLSSLFSCLFL